MKTSLKSLMKTPAKYLTLLALGAVLSAVTVVFGAVPMRVVWRIYGRTQYWLGHLAITGGLLAYGLLGPAMIFFALVVLIAVYSEVEAHGSTIFSSGALAILTSAGASAVAVGAYLYKSKAALLSEINSLVEPIAKQISELNPKVQVSVDSIVQQLPSGIIVLFMITLAVALIWDRRMMHLFRLQDRRFFERPRLLAFQVPDLCIWLVMVTILGAFLQHGQALVTSVSVNAINVFVVLYFFQGLAVVAQAFRTFKVSPFWQGIWYVLIAFQLFLLVSVIGFADFWLDFRERLSRKPAETSKSFE